MSEKLKPLKLRTYIEPLELTKEERLYLIECLESFWHAEDMEQDPESQRRKDLVENLRFKVYRGGKCQA